MCQVLESRLEQQIVTESLSRMPQPCRIVVSGPSGFNAAARGMLIAAGVSHDNITILEAWYHIAAQQNLTLNDDNFLNYLRQNGFFSFSCCCLPGLI